MQLGVHNHAYFHTHESSFHPQINTQNKRTCRYECMRRYDWACTYSTIIAAGWRVSNSWRKAEVPYIICPSSSPPSLMNAYGCGEMYQGYSVCKWRGLKESPHQTSSGSLRRKINKSSPPPPKYTQSEIFDF